MAENTIRSIKQAEITIFLDGQGVESVRRGRRRRPQETELTKEAIEAVLKGSTGPVEKQHQPLNVRQG